LKYVDNVFERLGLTELKEVGQTEVGQLAPEALLAQLEMSVLLQTDLPLPFDTYYFAPKECAFPSNQPRLFQLSFFCHIRVSHQIINEIVGSILACYANNIYESYISIL
ncbi:unnamed protein product, partial [marine sediment metagenome]